MANQRPLFRLCLDSARLDQLAKSRGAAFARAGRWVASTLGLVGRCHVSMEHVEPNAARIVQLDGEGRETPRPELLDQLDAWLASHRAAREAQTPREPPPPPSPDES